MEELREIHRFAAFRIHQSLVTKPLSIARFWPLRGDSVAPERLVMSKAMKAKILKMNGLDPNKFK